MGRTRTTEKSRVSRAMKEYLTDLQRCYRLRLVTRSLTALPRYAVVGTRSSKKPVTRRQASAAASANSGTIRSKKPCGAPG
jgi:hypothetical protein